MSGQSVRVIALALALLGAVALAVAAVLLLQRGDEAAPVVVVAPEPATPEATSQAILVQVSGAVVSPGVLAMREGDRVMDVIAAAGGLQADADLQAINLARRVEDEAHYHVPHVGEAPAISAQPAAEQPTGHGGPRQDARPSSGRSNALIDLNTASLQELDSLPDIGPITAERIIEYRNANGPFSAVDDVMEVSGIGPKTLESIRYLVTISSGP